MLFGSNTLFIWGESNLVVIENSFKCLCGVRKKMYQIKKTPPPTRDFMNERSLKLSKILNLNLLKFDCQSLLFSGSLASSKLNPFLFLQELKFTLTTISKTMQQALSEGLASFCTFGLKGECKLDPA